MCNPTLTTTPHHKTPHHHFLTPAARADMGRLLLALLVLQALLLAYPNSIRRAAVHECGRSFHSPCESWLKCIPPVGELLRTLQSPGCTPSFSGISIYFILILRYLLDLYIGMTISRIFVFYDVKLYPLVWILLFHSYFEW